MTVQPKKPGDDDELDGVRRSNLRALVREYKGPAELAHALKVNPSRVSHLLWQHKKFGARAARKYEVRLMKPKYWFDEDHDSPRDMSNAHKKVLAETLAAILEISKGKRIGPPKLFELVNMFLPGAVASGVVDRDAIKTVINLLK